MALFLFTKAILEGSPIDVFNNGLLRRDFTYIDDVVQATLRVLQRPPPPDPSWSSESPVPYSSSAPYRLYNVGNHEPTGVLELIAAIEEATGESASLNMLPMQPGDVASTYADVESLSLDFGFVPSTSLRSGVKRFVDWYRSYYFGDE